MVYNRERIYVSEDGKKAYNFVNICPEKLTFRKNLHKKIFLHNITDGWYHTVFNEVNVLPFGQAYPIEIYEFGMKTIERTRVSRKEFANIMFNSLTNAIAATWDEDKFHVIPHSSGYDSRLIALAIQRLNLKDYIFIEANGEHKQFKEIMNMLDEEYYITYDPSKPEETHKPEFKDAWKSANGYSGYPVNLWYDPIKKCQDRGIIPSDDNIQCYTGYGANEINTVMHKHSMYMNTNWDTYKRPNNIGTYFSWHYLHQLSGFALKGEWVHPFYDLGFIENFVKYSYGHIEHLRPGLSMSSIILQEIDPELASIHKMVTKEVRQLGYFKVSPETLKHAVSDYNKSWLGKQKQVKPSRNIEYSDWWGWWQVASLCEHLLEMGYEID